MKIYFNSLGVVTNFETEQADSLRQGSVGNKITAIFDGIIVSDCVPTLNFTRSDGSIISNVGMDIVDANKCELVFDDPWYFALAGNATMTIFLHDGSGNVVAQGQHLIAIESSDYDPSAVPPITQEEYNYLLAQLASKINKSGVTQLGESMSWSDGESEIFSYENGAFTVNLPVSFASLDAQAITINGQAAATEAYVQSELIPYATKTYVIEQLENYVSNSVLESTLNNYATKTYVQEQISAIVLTPYETKVDATAKYNELNGKINNVREVAEGKCRTYVVSYTQGDLTESYFTNGGKVYKPNGEEISTWEDFNEYVQNRGCGNNVFYSQTDEVNVFKKYILTIENVVIFYGFESSIPEGLKVGDIILVTQTDVPDRWIGRFEGGTITCYKLETAKVDLVPFVLHIDNSDIHVTSQDKTNWNGKSVVSGSGTGTSTTPISYITINGVEYAIVPAQLNAVWGQISGSIANQTDLKNALDAKQAVLTFDSTPTQNSSNPVTSGGVYTECKNIREVAEGKCKSYVIDTQSQITGTKDANDEYTGVTAITGVTLTDLKIGDVILIKELDKPDYWVSALVYSGDVLQSVSLNKMETTKVEAGTKLYKHYLTCNAGEDTVNIVIYSTSNSSISDLNSLSTSLQNRVAAFVATLLARSSIMGHGIVISNQLPIYAFNTSVSGYITSYQLTGVVSDTVTKV